MMQQVIPTDWTYRGNRVFMASRAQMARIFKPGNRHADLIQRVLDRMDPWEAGEDPIQPWALKGVSLVPETMRNNGTLRITWANHRGHRSRRRRLSPFVHPKIVPQTDTMTVILKGMVERPIIVQAYPADPEEPYIPPLPWMSSAEDADGGLEFCIDYWRTHSYIEPTRARLMDLNTITSMPPDWWSEAAA